MNKLMNDDLLAKVGGLAEQIITQRHPPRRGTTSPLSFHWADADFLGLHLDPFRPGQDFRAQQLLGDGIFQRGPGWWFLFPHCDAGRPRRCRTRRLPGCRTAALQARCDPRALER